jgi:hypothetical protein
MQKPKFTIGMLEEYYFITQDDILFTGDTLFFSDPFKRKAFVAMCMKHNGHEEIKDVKSLNDMPILEFTKIFKVCLNAYMAEIKLCTEEAKEIKEPGKKK